MKIVCVLIAFISIASCTCHKILAVFPYNGRSHHIFYSSLVEELAARKHDVTVVNYFPVKKMPNLRHISLQSYKDPERDIVDMKEHLKINSDNIFADFFKAYDLAKAFEYIANSNCEKLVNNEDVQIILSSGMKFDLVIAEQFVTDCGLALAHELNAPAIGMAAHVPMPWTYSRLGAPNNPSFVPNSFFASGTKPHLWNRIKSVAINWFMNTYYNHVIQRNDNDIVRKVFRDMPDLESLGRNISLFMFNQYFPLTGSQIYGANVIEIGGMHINHTNSVLDEELTTFLNTAKNGVIYISFGTVASNFPTEVLNKILKVLDKSDMKFIWKVDDVNALSVPKNTLLRKWLPQPAVLCHPKVLAFISHSGMLSSSEAMHCGVPIVSVPLFGDQFTNAASAVENGLGIMVDLRSLDENILESALNTVLGERYQNRAKQLSQVWRDRPLAPIDTAIYWIEHVARHRGSINMKPPTVDLPLYQYLLIDVAVIIIFVITIIIYTLIKVFGVLRNISSKKPDASKKKVSKKNR